MTALLVPYWNFPYALKVCAASRIDWVVVLLGYDEDISREEKLEILQSCPPRIRNWLLENGDLS
jgi:hypothetical protein